jgi:hypothetical protein
MALRPTAKKRLGMAALLLAAISCVWIAAPAQRNEIQRLFRDLQNNRQPPKDTEFVFARIRFNGRYSRRTMGGFMFRGMEGWAHDYPDAEEHILQVTEEATNLNVRKDSYGIVDLSSQELFKYPFIYFSEVGEMNITPQEAANFREHLNRGGFAMVDDFDGQGQLDWFLSQMKQVFPNRDFVEMNIEHPLFHTHYELPTLDVIPPYEVAAPPKFYGYYDDHGRLCMIINLNHDLGDFWEWIDQPMYPLAPSTEALRFGINYFLFSLTH